jgi:hypothetical protein
MHTRRGVCLLLMSLLCATACTSRGGDAVADPRFVVLNAGVVHDARTGLEWTRHDDGAGLDWHGAEAYCQSLSIDDAKGWRLPSIEELGGLYGAITQMPCGDAKCAIDPAFALTSPYVWSATAPNPNARTYLDFRFGTRLSPSISPRLVRRVLCVRTGPGTA